MLVSFPLTERDDMFQFEKHLNSTAAALTKMHMRTQTHSYKSVRTQKPGGVSSFEDIKQAGELFIHSGHV